MRKFNSSALLTPHSYLSTVSELLEAANKIRPNSDAEIKVLFLYHIAWQLQILRLIYSGKTLWQVYNA